MEEGATQVTSLTAGPGGSLGVYTTALQPSALYTSYVGGVARMDITLLRPTLSPRCRIPVGGPMTHSALIAFDKSTSTVRALNAGLLGSDRNGGPGASLRTTGSMTTADTA